ncbi:MAG: Signal transduction histidine kinase/PAS domain-containing protein/CheY, partial [Verrucomicrobia bacterium]
MAIMPQLPRRSWLERTSLCLAGGLALIGAAALTGWWLHVDVLIQPLAGFAPITPNAALCAFLMGAALLAREFGWPRTVAGSALPVAVLSALTLGEYALHTDFKIDELVASDYLVALPAQAARMSLDAAACLLLASGGLIWRGLSRHRRGSAGTGAIVGSLVGAVGFSTLLGYLTSLPSTYNGNGVTALSPVSGLVLLLLGSAVLLLAWREAVQIEGRSPPWAPMPATVACFTLTLILWMGLRTREQAYTGIKTQTSMEGLATTINYELDRQKSLVDRLATNWGGMPEDSTIVRETDAHLQMDELRQLGGVSLAWVTPGLRTSWVYPRQDNEGALNYDHRGDAVRLSALEEAAAAHRPVVSGTTDIAGLGPGFVIYAPVMRAGQPVGFVAAEFLYRPFFASLIHDRKLAANYHVTVLIGPALLYDSEPGSANPPADLALDKTYPIFNRRIRLSFTSRGDVLASDRHYLPELALAAGLGLTLLLGLSVHFARTARTRQRTTEVSNRQLLAENEERRRVEERLQVSDERLRLALDSTLIGIFEWTVATNHVYYSPGLWAMLGYEHQGMPATIEALQSLIHPEDLPPYRQRIAAQLAGTASFIEPEYRVRAHDGEWRWVHTRSKTVAAGPDHRPSRIIGTVQDITARREAELALRASQAEARKLSLVASKTDNPVLIGSPQGTIEWVNESFTRVMEYSLEEVVGRNPADFMAGPETHPRKILLIRAAMARGRALSTDIVNYSKSGRKYHLHLEIQPVRNEAGQLETFIAIETDITARVETETQLRLAKAEADDASRAKSEFLASMSHEIRTPMNGVIGMTSLLMDSKLSPEQRDYVNTIRFSGEALLTIINDILDFSKIESGKMDLEHLPFELAGCLEETLDLFALQAAAKKIDLAYHIEPGVPPWVFGDVTRVRQILVNLVNNAVKFTPRGHITIVVRSTPAADSTGAARCRLEFTVRDTGIGIPPDRVERLFKAFSQIDSTTTRKYGGTGLGLVISQRLCALMGGDIRVESTVGHGAAFIFSIVTEADTELVTAPPPPLVAGLRSGPVLCVDDNPVTQKRLSNLLKSVGATGVFATDLTAACALAGTLRQPPGFMVFNGTETAAESLLKILPPAVPCVFMLPFGSVLPAGPADGRRFTFVFKPLKTGALLQAFATLGGPPTAPVLSGGTKTPFERVLAQEFPLALLIAEDNTVNQKVAVRFLERLGYGADAVSNGLEAIAAVEARNYDVVFMDLQMPELDGLEASRQIRQRLPANRQPKIVALT